MNIVCYMPMLEGQLPEVDAWLSTVGQRHGIIPLLLPPMDWNNDLTPWPSGPIFKKGKPFGGQAEGYLHKLETEIIPDLEKDLGLVPDERWLLGVSLAGLFAVWAAARTPLFTRVASVSGSFWYPGFSDWFSEQTIYAESCYLSLGDREAAGKNPHLKIIAEETEKVVRILHTRGIPTTFEWTAGTHFGPLLPRLDQALDGLKA